MHTCVPMHVAIHMCIQTHMCVALLSGGIDVHVCAQCMYSLMCKCVCAVCECVHACASVHVPVRVDAALLLCVTCSQPFPGARLGLKLQSYEPWTCCSGGS